MKSFNINWPTEECSKSWRPAGVCRGTVPVVQRRVPVAWGEEIVTRTLTARAVSPVVRTTAEISGRGLSQNRTAVSECSPVSVSQ